MPNMRAIKRGVSGQIDSGTNAAVNCQRRGVTTDNKVLEDKKKEFRVRSQLVRCDEGAMKCSRCDGGDGNLNIAR